MCDGLLLHPIIGWKKANDYQPNVVLSAYRYLRDHFYPKERVILSGLQLSTYYAGPREAILHAIVRQNYGCTHFIVGRDHAGVGNHYDKYAAHRLAETVQPLVEVQILRFKEPFYCTKCAMIATENTCGHGEQDREQIDGTSIRELLLNSKHPPANWMREELVQEILKHDPLLVPG